MLTKLVLLLTAILLALILVAIGAAIYHGYIQRGQCQNLFVTNGQTSSQC
jgi:hypothetical protein